MTFVMLHHPGYDDPEAREADMKRIIAELRRRDIGFMSTGGLGSGYRVSTAANDVPQWKQLIDELLKAGVLKGYTKWGLDERGHGFVLL